MIEERGLALLAGGLLVAIASLGLALQSRARAAALAWIGVLGIALTFATIAHSRRLEASAQAWILLSFAVFWIEISLLRALRKVPGQATGVGDDATSDAGSGSDADADAGASAGDGSR